MSVVTGSANAGLGMRNSAPIVAGLFAGAAIKVAAPCYIKSDGKVYECNGASGSASAVIGFAAAQRNADEPVALYGAGAIFQYNQSDLATPGAELFLSTTTGMLATTAQTGDKGAVAVVTETGNILIVRANGIHSTGA